MCGNQKQQEVIKLSGALLDASPTEQVQKTLDTSDQRVIAATVATTHETCHTTAEATEMLERLYGFIQRSRQQDYAVVIIPEDEMRTNWYAIFDQVIPHGAMAEPGSAHDAIEKALLDSLKNEVGLVHDLRRSSGRDSCEQCEVRICLFLADD